MRISDWSPDVCSSALPLPNGSHRRARAPVANHAVALFRGDPSSVMRQLGENLIDLDLADRRRGLVVCIDPPPLNRAARIPGIVHPVLHPRLAHGTNGPKYPVAVPPHPTCMLAALGVLPNRTNVVV